MTCELLIPGTFFACGEEGNYCSAECLDKAMAPVDLASERARAQLTAIYVVVDQDPGDEHRDIVADAKVRWQRRYRANVAAMGRWLAAGTGSGTPTPQPVDDTD